MIYVAWRIRNLKLYLIVCTCRPDIPSCAFTIFSTALVLCAVLLLVKSGETRLLGS